MNGILELLHIKIRKNNLKVLIAIIENLEYVASLWVYETENVKKKKGTVSDLIILRTKETKLKMKRKTAYETENVKRKKNSQWRLYWERKKQN